MAFEPGNSLRKPTRGLFREYNTAGTDSIERWRQVFIELEDVTEYMPAHELAGSWDEWNRFKREWPHFNVILAEWHEELEIKLRSKAVQKLIVAAQKDTKAAIWLAEGRYKDKRRGRPSKQEIQHEAKVKEKVIKETDDEVSRVLDTLPFAASK